MRAPACLALLLLSACSFPIKATIPPEEQALRRPENRAGILVGDELVRVSWLPELTTNPAVQAARTRASAAGARRSPELTTNPAVQAADPARFADIGAAGAQPWLIASRLVEGRAVISFAGRPDGWGGGLISMQDNLWPALTAARDGSAFHAPIQAAIGQEVVWAIGDLVPVGMLRPGGESLATVELYSADPRLGQPRPVVPRSIFVVARRAPNGDEVRRDPRDLGLLSRPNGFFQVGRVERSGEGRLTGLEFTAWRPDISAVMGGQVASDVLGIGHPNELMMERLLTDALVEWKTRQFPTWIASADREKLDQAVIGAEKGMLQLDLKSRLVKDEIDAAARQGAGSQPAFTEKAQIYDQRKTLVVVVLGSLKTARAQAR